MNAELLRNLLDRYSDLAALQVDCHNHRIDGRNYRWVVCPLPLMLLFLPVILWRRSAEIRGRPVDAGLFYMSWLCQQLCSFPEFRIAPG